MVGIGGISPCRSGPSFRFGAQLSIPLLNLVLLHDDCPRLLNQTKDGWNDGKENGEGQKVENGAMAWWRKEGRRGTGAYSLRGLINCLLPNCTTHHRLLPRFFADGVFANAGAANPIFLSPSICRPRPSDVGR